MSVPVTVMATLSTLNPAGVAPYTDTISPVVRPCAALVFTVASTADVRVMVSTSANSARRVISVRVAPSSANTCSVPACTQNRLVAV